eukprot:IDg6418t1
MVASASLSRRSRRQRNEGSLQFHLAKDNVALTLLPSCGKEYASGGFVTLAKWAQPIQGIAEWRLRNNVLLGLSHSSAVEQTAVTNRRVCFVNRRALSRFRIGQRFFCFS